MDIDSLVPINTIDCKQGAIRAVRYNIDGTYCITCGADKKLKLWNAHKSLLLKTYGGHANEVLDAAGSCDSSQILSGSSDKSVILWDVASGLPTRRLRGHASSVSCVKFNEESTLAISGSHDNTVMCWDLKSRRQQPVQVLKEAKDSISSLVVSDHEIISASLDGRIRKYDLRAGELITDCIGKSITHIEITRDDQCYLAACADSTLRLMDKSSGELLSEYVGHNTQDFAVECAIMYSDNFIISGTTEGSIIIWDLLSSKEIKKLHREESSIKSVIPTLVSHPKKNEILSACRGEVTLWGILDTTIVEVEESQTLI
ncbi:WD repeat domain-containing protein 83-like [Ctenocephalides felis]|uniref:WD repeat domain-containing protein 83-like n=1 Tax=Ctenocephalides felis TaxID=7515 RepID=UPI000E6E17B8|nr:WD repeat domain-containing protein 83-like [Ctenocephalides felis]